MCKAHRGIRVIGRSEAFQTFPVHTDEGRLVCEDQTRNANTLGSRRSCGGGIRKSPRRTSVRDLMAPPPSGRSTSSAGEHRAVCDQLRGRSGVVRPRARASTQAPTQLHRPFRGPRPGRQGHGDGCGRPPPPKECWLSHLCTGGRQKAQKMWLVSGLQDHRYLSVKIESKDARG